MTPEELAFSVIRNQISLENLSRRLAAKATPQLREVYKQLQELVRELPGDKIARDLRYRLLVGRIETLLQGPNDTLYGELVSGLSEAAPEQLEQAAKTLGLNAQQAEASVASISPAQVVALTDDTKVLGKRLETLFRPADGTRSAWIRSEMKQIDLVVKQGFLLGETNDEIARNLALKVGRGQAGMRAVARTAVMDMSQRAHDRVYAANRNAIALYRYDATFDFRVCLQCAPLDGKESKSRGDLPDTPIHPNCRCRVRAITKTQLLLEEEDRQQSRERSVVEIAKSPSQASGRVYKTKAKVDGEKFTKFAHEVRVPKGQDPTMGWFIQKANPLTRETVLGVTRAREWEYLVNDNRGPKRKNLDDVLRDLVKADVRSLEKAQKARAKRRK